MLFRSLLYSLDKRIDYEFKVLNIKTLMKLFFIANNYKIIHIHSSNPWVRLYVVIVCKLFNIKSINTIHGDLVRFRSNVKNRVDIAAIRLSDKPILLNKGSYEVAKLINNNSEIISAFIPPACLAPRSGLTLNKRSNSFSVSISRQAMKRQKFFGER